MNYDNGSIDIASKELGYRLEGSGDRHVVLLHGLNSHSGTWRKTFPALVSRFSVLAPSLPTHSGTVSAELIGRYSEQVLEMCERLWIRRAAVVGSSIGGWVGMHLAASRKLLVERLVLEDTAGSASDDVKGVDSLSIPTLIVWGTEDEVIPLSKGRSLHSALGGSELRTITGAQHVPHWEQPDEFNRLLQDFLG